MNHPLIIENLIIQKCIPLDELLTRRAQWRSEQKTVVTTNGCFDIIHKGHVTYLGQARALGDLLIVAVNTDDTVQRQKGPNRPIHPLDDRLTVLSALIMVDFVIPFSEDTPMELLDQLKPDIHTKGGDYHLETLPETPFIVRNGGRIVILPFVSGYSSTRILTQSPLSTPRDEVV